MSTTQEQGGRGRQHCALDFTAAFEESAAELAGLGPTRAIRLATATASARAFFDQWKTRTSATDHELSTGRWKYKRLHGKRARTANLRQIYLDGARGLHRAALVVEEGSGGCVVRFLLTYHKRDQDPGAIDRATGIARLYREEGR